MPVTVFIHGLLRGGAQVISKFISYLAQGVSAVICAAQDDASLDSGDNKRGEGCGPFGRKAARDELLREGIAQQAIGFAAGQVQALARIDRF